MPSLKHGEISEVTAEYGIVEGVIEAFLPPKLVGPDQTNGKVMLASGLEFELSYNRDYTILDISGVKGLAVMHELDKLAEVLVPGTRVEVKYSPCRYQGSTLRAQSIAEKQEVNA